MAVPEFKTEQEVVAHFQRVGGSMRSPMSDRRAARHCHSAACRRLPPPFGRLRSPPFTVLCPHFIPHPHSIQLLEERDQLTSASIERQQEMSEHDLVIKTLEPLEGGRKCFRLVGEVLVERTVAEVLPAVKKNRENLAAVRQLD